MTKFYVTILKLVAFEAENYLEYLCKILLSWDNGFRRYRAVWDKKSQKIAYFRLFSMFELN